MTQNAWMKPTMCLVVSLVLVLLMGLAVMPTKAQPGEAKVQRVIFASAGFDETNRFWVISRPNQLQNDPYLETLLDLDPKTGAFIPRLAEKWEASPDMKELRCGKVDTSLSMVSWASEGGPPWSPSSAGCAMVTRSVRQASAARWSIWRQPATSGPMPGCCLLSTAVGAHSERRSALPGL